MATRFLATIIPYKGNVRHDMYSLEVVQHWLREPITVQGFKYLALSAYSAEEGGDMADDVELISVWEFEKESDLGGSYWVFASGWDTRGAESPITLEVESEKPIAEYRQLHQLAQEAGDKGFVQVGRIFNVMKIK
ncbi:MAG: hypothetical protein ABIT47_02145 [Candidatus Paceibacterota bacterium]